MYCLLRLYDVDHRFKTLDGSTSRSNNQKAMDERREALREQIEEAGGNPDE